MFLDISLSHLLSYFIHTFCKNSISQSVFAFSPQGQLTETLAFITLWYITFSSHSRCISWTSFFFFL